MASYPSGLRDQFAKLSFAGSNPADASKSFLIPAKRWFPVRRRYEGGESGRRLISINVMSPPSICLNVSYNVAKINARVVELVDTMDLKSIGSNAVPVRVRLRVPIGFTT